jgi:hypothetical protein
MSILGATGIYEYSIGAKLAYDKENDEIYIVNPAYDYSYAYNIPTKSWIKRGESFDDIFNLNQDSFSTDYTSNMVFRFYEQYGEGVLPILFETKPINLGTPSYKKIKGLVIRGAFEPEYGKLDNQPLYDKLLGAYLWVSKDGRNYTLLEAIQIQKKCNDIVFKRFPITVKFFVVIMCGHLTNDSYIAHIDVDYDLVYDKKLR